MAQLSTLGHIMRITYFMRLTLIVIWQAAMVTCFICFDPSPHRWIPSAFAVAALLLPFIGYIAAIYDAPFFMKWPRILKAGVLTLLSVVFTIGGYVAFFIAGALVYDHVA